MDKDFKGYKPVKPDNSAISQSFNYNTLDYDEVLRKAEEENLQKNNAQTE